MGDTIVFLGPSLPVADARRLLDADYRSPAQRGDIYRCLGVGARRIVLIDGLFHGVPSVWQREILSALDDGIEVLGASSMGALRGAELQRYGMVGHGTIFGWYADGVIDGDDEVALLHGDASTGFRTLSEPLVNLRATLARAAEGGVVSSEEAERLAAEAKATFYPQRSLRRLLEGQAASGWSSARRDAVRGRLQELRVDLKRQDAEAVLRHCAATAPAGEPSVAPSRDSWRRERTLARSIASVDGEAVLELARSRGAADRLKQRLVVGWYAVRAAAALGLAGPDDELRELRRRREAKLVHRDRVTAFEVAAWLHDRVVLDWLASRPALLPGDGGVEQRLEALGRDWLRREWAIDVAKLPDPRDLHFGWSFESDLVLELLLTGEVDALLEGAR